MDIENLNFYEQLKICREKLLMIGTSKDVPLPTAEIFIKLSAYWDHPKAGWVEAPKHSERIEYGSFGYELRFGSNYFLVGLAITRCISEVSSLLDRLEQEYSNDFDRAISLHDQGKKNDEKLISALYLHVRGAVANTDSNEYKGYYPIQADDRMVFGTQAINVHWFTWLILHKSDIRKMHEY